MNPKGKDKQESDPFRLIIPLEADPEKEAPRDQEVKVLLQLADGERLEKVVKLGSKRAARAVFEFDQHPGKVKVLLGPGGAPGETLEQMQTLSRTINANQWLDKNELSVAIKIPPYYLIWWPMWCRKFTITGKVVCADGRPVPGATVKAFDIDGFWWWISKQFVGSDVTGIDGTFQISFTWCCGWWPWFWWNFRRWEIDPILSDKIIELLKKVEIPVPIPEPDPDPRFFDTLLADLEVGPLMPSETRRTKAFDIMEPADLQPPKPMEALAPDMEAGAEAGLSTQVSSKAQLFQGGYLDKVRNRLLDKLPQIEGVELLHPWPWWPWKPWFDCHPDIIFEVTQPCEGETNVIFEETWADTRWNIPTNLNVTLTANDKACCVYDNDDPVGDCIFLSHVCHSINLNQIGGNLTAPAVPTSLWGYAYPNGSDRPFGGLVPIFGEFGVASGADFYELEYWNVNKLPAPGWDALPLGTFIPPTRTYFGPELGGGPMGSHAVPFPIQHIDGHNVIETRRHYETSHEPAAWGVIRGWYLSSVYLLGRWRTASFADGLHTLRVKSYDLVGGHLANPRVLNQCYYNPPTPNFLRLRIDNRVSGPASGHPWIWAAHPCGAGTVHICTLEPETVILAIKILNHDGTLKATVGACGNVEVDANDLVEFDIVAYDKDGHLNHYTLQVTYADNLKKRIAHMNSLNPLVGATFVPSPGPGAAAQQGPSYAQALVDAPPAVRPAWHGGAISIRAHAADVFPITCSYQLELRSYKRTIVSCNHDWPHRNLSERSFFVRRV